MALKYNKLHIHLEQLAKNTYPAWGNKVMVCQCSPTHLLPPPQPCPIPSHVPFSKISVFFPN